MTKRLTIETPAGKRDAPTGAAAKYAAMTDEELFATVDQGPFVDPFTLGEIQRRNKLAAYYRWCDDQVRQIEESIAGKELANNHR